MTLIMTTLYLAIPLVVLVSIYRRNTITEDNFFLKWVGYYILGAFSFTINQLTLPLGFLVYLFFLRQKPKQNKGLKGTAAMVGLTFFFIQLASPAIEAKVFQWPREVQIEEENVSVYEFSFQHYWKKIAQKFEISFENPKLKRSKIGYRKDGIINSMEFEIVDKGYNQFIHYYINYSTADQSFVIARSRTDSWQQYNRLIRASTYFSKLDSIDIQDLPMDKDYTSYTLKGRGEKRSYSLLTRDNYIVDREQIKRVHNYELPIKGYLIRLSGKAQGSYKSHYVASLYFNATYNPRENGPYSAKDAIAVLRGDQRVEAWMVNHYGEEIRKQENGQYYRKFQGEWQRVSEKEYRKKIDPFKRSEELSRQEWHITYQAKYGDEPYTLRGVVSQDTGEIISISME